MYLVHYGICKSLETQNELSFLILQGEAIKRDGGMRVNVKIENGNPILVQIVGQAVVAFKTEIEV
jgi:predicted PhzF superfamily epimerase YddE/YHI9